MHPTWIRRVAVAVASLSLLVACGQEVAPLPEAPAATASAALKAQSLLRTLRLRSPDIAGSLSAFSYNAPEMGGEQVQIAPTFVTNMDEVCTESPALQSGEGVCHVTRCDYSKGIEFAGGGELRVRGSVSPGQEDIRTSTALVDGIPLPYLAGPLSRPYLTGGERVRFDLEGDPQGQKGFSVSETAPYGATMTAPDFATARISRQQDLIVRWTTASVRPKVKLGISVIAPDYSKQVYCDFPAADGMGVVPSSLLRQLDAGPAIAASTTCSGQIVRTFTRRHGEWVSSRFPVSVCKEAVTGAGATSMFFGVPATLQ
jgi:hypothetical protein